MRNENWWNMDGDDISADLSSSSFMWLEANTKILSNKFSKMEIVNCFKAPSHPLKWKIPLTFQQCVHIFTARVWARTKSIILPPFCATSVLERVKSYLFVENISSDYIRKENESITFVRHTHPNQKTLSPSQTHIFWQLNRGETFPFLDLVLCCKRK